MSLAKTDLKQIEHIFDQKLDEKLAEQTKELKDFAREQTEELARIIQDSVVEPMDTRFNHVDMCLDKIESQINPKIPFISWKKI